jgi:hypothetical protein
MREFWLPRLFSWRLFWYRHLQGLLAKRGQDLKRKGKAEPAAVDAIYQNTVVRDHTEGLQPSGKLLVGDTLGLTQFFDERFGTEVVELARPHFRQSCIVFDARIVKGFRRLPQ